MVQINFGEIVNDARGKINGVVYSKNKAGAYIRTKVTPSNPQTTYQSEARNRLSNFAKAWADLTATQRSDWNEYGRSFGSINPFGAKKPISGLAAYIRCNTVLLNAGETALTDAPADNLVTEFDTAAIVLDESGNNLSVTTTPAPFAADHNIYLSATPVIPAGQSFVKNRFRYIDSAAVSSPNTFLWPAARLGDIAVGDQVFFKLQTLNTLNGALSTGTIIRVEVTA